MKKLFLMIGLFLPATMMLAGTQYYRASYRDDPTTTIVIGWSDNGTSNNATVYYGTQDFSTVWSAYPSSHTVDRTVSHRGKTNRFARLTGLTPNTVYYFVIRDESGSSSRMSFKTLSDDPNIPVMFINGGDTRTGADGFEFETDLCEPRRRKGFDLVAKIRPDFVAFSGDYIFSENFLVGGDQLWTDWLVDWQRTIGGPETKGHLIPVVGVYGNHEDNDDLYNLFDIPNNSNYYSFSGGKLFRFYCLNTDLECDDTQLTWFTNDLQAYTGNSNEPYWKFIQYHIPMAPHGEYSVIPSLINCWASLFAQYNVRLSMDGHSHVMKITNPITPGSGSGSDSGFAPDNENGCVYIGEGSWGAPMRNLYTTSGGKAYSWTLAQGKFAGLNIITVYKQKYEVRSVDFDQTNIANVSQVGQNDAPGTLPSSGLVYWNMNGSTVFTLYNNHFTFSNDASLAQLYTSLGNLSPSFSASELHYTVVLPASTTVVPSVYAVPTHPGASVTITPAQQLQGNQVQRTATILVTAEDLTTTQTYTIEFQLESGSDASLSSITVSTGTLMPAFSPSVLNYTVDLPASTVNAPNVSATANDPAATVQIAQASAPDGIATVTVISADNSTNLVYSVDFIVAAADTKIITAFEIAGQLQPALINQETHSITAFLSEETNLTALSPVISYIGQSLSPASGQAQNFTSPVVYTVTAFDNSTVQYTATVQLEEANSDNAYLASLSVDPGTLEPVFLKTQFSYVVNLDEGTESIDITAVPESENAMVRIFPPVNLMGSPAQRTANIIVVAADGVTSNIYSILFAGANSNENFSGSKKHSEVYPNPVSDMVKIKTKVPSGKVRLMIHNGFGQLLLNRNDLDANTETTFDMSGYEPGTYFILVIYEGGSDLHKVIKIR